MRGPEFEHPQVRRRVKGGLTTPHCTLCEGGRGLPILDLDPSPTSFSTVMSYTACHFPGEYVLTCRSATSPRVTSRIRGGGIRPPPPRAHRGGSSRRPGRGRPPPGGTPARRGGEVHDDPVEGRKPKPGGEVGGVGEHRDDVSGAVERDVLDQEVDRGGGVEVGGDDDPRLPGEGDRERPDPPANMSRTRSPPSSIAPPRTRCRSVESRAEK